MDDDVRVLVVDDYPDAAQSLAAVLQASGYRVRTAGNGEQALTMFEAFQPQCVLLDIDMPGMDGRTLAQAVRDRHGGDTVIVAVTGWGDERDGHALAQWGIDYCLRKPVDLGRLATILPPLH